MQARPIRSPLTAIGLRPDEFVLIVIVAGATRLLRGRLDEALRGPAVAWLPPGPEGRLEVAAGARGGVLEASSPFAMRAMPGGLHPADAQRLTDAPVFGRSVSHAKAGRHADLVTMIADEQAGGAPGAGSAMRHCLSLLMLEIWRLSAPTASGAPPLPRQLVHGFLGLLEANLYEHWSIARYAKRLGVSTDRLNSAVRRATGRSPLALAHNRLMLEAEQLLNGTGLQVAEVADRLGFRDPAYFSRFFQRHAGMPPGRYRSLAAAGAGARSFAAWP